MAQAKSSFWDMTHMPLGCAQQYDGNLVLTEVMKGPNIPLPGLLSSLLHLKCFVTDGALPCMATETCLCALQKVPGD